MQIEWCTNKISVEEAEAKNLVEDKRLGDEPIPFGFINYQWLNLIESMHEGDELWEFRSPQKSWDRFAGREGICVVRDGEVVGYIITGMN